MQPALGSFAELDFSPQRAEDVGCAGRGMLVTKPAMRRQVTMSCWLFLAGIRGSCSLPGESWLSLPCGDFLHQQKLSDFLSAALWGVQAVEPGMAVLSMETVQGWDTREKTNSLPCPSAPFASLCPQRNAVPGTSGDQLWSSPAPSALQGDKEKLFSSLCTPLDARMDAQPKRLL